MKNIKFKLISLFCTFLMLSFGTNAFAMKNNNNKLKPYTTKNTKNIFEILGHTSKNSNKIEENKDKIIESKEQSQN